MAGGIAIDPQILGRDNGTESGVLDTHPLDGDFVLRPVLEGQFISAATGTSSVSIALETSNYNPARSNTSLLVTVPAGLGNSADVRFAFWGTKVGISLQRSVTQTSQGAFAAEVDGVAVEVIPACNLMDTQTACATNFDQCAFYPLAKDLKDGYHELALKFISDPSNAWVWSIYGLLLDRKAGYPAPDPVTMADLITAVPNTATMILAQAWQRGLSAIHYYNPTGSTRTVTITWKGTVIDVLSIAAGATAYWPRWGQFRLPWRTGRSGSTNLTHTCDAAASVVATVFTES